MKKTEIGSIYSLKADKNKIFFQFVSTDKNGELIKVFTDEENDNLNSLKISKNFFFIYFPISLAFKENIISYEGSVDLRDFKKPLFMRSKHIIRGDFKGWHIINIETLKREFVKELNEEQKKLSPFGIWNPSLLIERLKDGWNLNNW